MFPRCAANAKYAHRATHIPPSVYSRHKSSTAPPQITGTIPPGGRGIAVSQFAEIERIFTAEDISRYAALVGDSNPIHRRGHGGGGRAASEDHDEIHVMAADKCAVASNFIRLRKEDGQPEAVAHGMLIGSLFSSIFGTLIPGSVYRSQRLEFRQPVFANDPIVARVDVADVRKMKGRGLLVTCDTTIVSAQTSLTVYVEGEAKVWLPGI